MVRVFRYTISNAEALQSVASYLKTKGFSRHLIASLKKEANGICVNQIWVHTNQVLNAEDILTVTLREEAGSGQIEPVPLPLSIVWEDEDLMVLNKPAGMPVHPSINHTQDTLANGLTYYFDSQHIPFVFRCINRLDRDTSGLLIVAKHLLSGALLSEQMKRHEIQRTYLAIVKGHPPLSGTITAPIARKANSIIERCVDFETGETAVTHFQTLQYQDGYSLVQCRLDTGRTHQIRVHMGYLGYPLIGDFLYYPDYEKITRQALHSYSLEFEHPITGETMKFQAKLPDDMKWIDYCPSGEKSDD